MFLSQNKKKIMYISVSPIFPIIKRIFPGRSLNWAQGYKTFFMLNSIEHEIFPANKY